MSTGMQYFLALGGSTLIACLVTLGFTAITNYLKNRKNNIKSELNDIKLMIELLKKSMQSILRHELYEMYFKFMKKGFATSEEKQDFENLWNNYHNLGKNGVMNKYRDKVLSLPEKK